MIIRLFIRDFLSFYDEVEFSLYPGKGSVLSNHIIREDNRDDIPTLKSAVIYGANASGKSNLVKALSFLKFMVTKGFPVDRGISYNPYKLKNRKTKNFSKIEIEIKTNNKNYAYGFEFDENKIIEEWLFIINKRSDKEIFTRKLIENKYKTTFKNISFSTKENEEFAKFTARGTPKNRLFIREAKERELDFIEDINKVYEWFDTKLKIIFPKTKYRDLVFQLDKDEDFANLFSNLLTHFKTGIHKLIKKSIDPEKDIKNIPIAVVQDIINSLKPQKQGLLSIPGEAKNYAFQKSKDGKINSYILVTQHLKNDGTITIFDLEEESDGTLRLMDIIPALIDLTNNDSVYVIDELDRSMHPILTKGIIEYFFSNSGSVHSQLIVTSHESCLLDLSLLRKDEIWFVEKNKKGETQLYSLLEFKPRSDINIRKGYLNGRYGAIPFLSNPKDLNWE